MVRGRLAQPIALALGVSVAMILLLLSGRAKLLLGATTEVPATIMELRPHDHASVAYEYEVDGSEYRGGGIAGTGTPPLKRLSVGDTITVAVLTSAPSISAPGTLGPRIHKFALFAALLFVFTLVFHQAWLWHSAKAR